MANSSVSLRSIAVTTIVGILVWLTVLAMFGIKFPVVGVKWSEVPSLDEHPNAKPEGAASVDPSVQSLRFANIGLNTPAGMNSNETAVVELLVGLTTPSDELEKKFEGAGIKEFAGIRVSERMEARLTGSNFAIVAITPEEQAIPHTNVAGWKWEVKPTREGRHSLHLTLSAVGQTNNLPAQSVLRAFDKQIKVDVTGLQPLWSYTETTGDPNAQWTACAQNLGCAAPPLAASQRRPDS